MSEFKTPVKSNKINSGRDTMLSGGEELTIPPSPFLNRLGYGTGVSVMQLDRSPREGQIRSPWALKMLNKKVKPNKIFSERLKEEAELLQNMSHPNIVGFRAFSEDKILYLGMEVCNESLGDMIEAQVESYLEPFTPRQMLKVAVDIGSALEYLHTTMRIMHGDVKSYNILVNGKFVICKLCDFGVTLPLAENGVFDENTRAHYYGTEAWSAPEVIHGGQISHKTDIWPLGLTLWEMMALMPPHCLDYDESALASMTGLDDSSISMAKDDYCLQRYGTRPSLPAKLSEEQYRDPLSLFHACTELEPARRPPADRVAQLARDMLARCTDTTTDDTTTTTMD